MNVLALDTSTEYCSCALRAGGEVRQRLALAGQTHSRLLLPMVSELLAEAGLTLGQLHGIAVAVGPGSFTGVRIAAAVGQGLAFGAGLPVAAVGTLDALAWGTGAGRVLACTDARMGEVYAAAFLRADGNLLAAAGPQVSPPGQVTRPDSSGWCGVGSGFARHAEALAVRLEGCLSRVLPDVHPEARHVLGLALAREPAGFGAPPESLVPLYVRDKVALTVAER